jgi:membrane-bound inhibitor of C-type lysozyme
VVIKATHQPRIFTFSWAWLLMFVWLFVGCAAATTPIDPASIQLVDFECGQVLKIEGALDLRSRQLSVQLPEEDSQRILHQVPSGSGAKYSDGEVLIWTKGANAIIEQFNQKSILDCRVNERK